MDESFSKKTFQYFDSAKRNRKKKEWFEKNKKLYQEAVLAPFSALVEQIDSHLSEKLPGIIIHPKKISRPLRPANRAEAAGGPVKTHAHITLWEKRSSLFEWNPGIHIQFGAEKDDNFYGLGLYMVSSRQLSLLRNGIAEDYSTIHKILTNPRFKKTWPELLGDTYKRFPKGFDPAAPYAKYLWQKQFYVGRNLNRKQVMQKNLAGQIVKDLEVAMPFFQWIRETVGTFRKLDA